MPRINGEKAVRRRHPSRRPFFEDLVTYSNHQKRVYAAHLIVTLCKFGRWLSWAFFPRFRFFPGLTDSVDGAMSWEMKAKLTLNSNPNLPRVMDVISSAFLTSKSFGVKKGA